MTQVPGGIKTATELFSLFNEMEQRADTVHIQMYGREYNTSGSQTLHRDGCRSPNGEAWLPSAVQKRFGIKKIPSETCPCCSAAPAEWKGALGTLCSPWVWCTSARCLARQLLGSACSAAGLIEPPGAISGSPPAFRIREGCESLLAPSQAA